MSVQEPDLDSNPLVDLLEATDEVCGMYRMLYERQPQLRPALEESLIKVRDELERIFQPYLDLEAGTITREQFLAVLEEREQRLHDERELKWADSRFDDEDMWIVECETCHADIEYEDLPPLHPVCDPCRAEAAAEKEALHADA